LRGGDSRQGYGTGLAARVFQSALRENVEKYLLAAAFDRGTPGIKSQRATIWPKGRTSDGLSLKSAVNLSYPARGRHLVIYPIMRPAP